MISIIFIKGAKLALCPPGADRYTDSTSGYNLLGVTALGGSVWFLLPIETVGRVPVVLTGRPGQGPGEGREEEVQTPSDDHVVEEICVESYQHDSPAGAWWGEIRERWHDLMGSSGVSWV